MKALPWPTTEQLLVDVLIAIGVFILVYKFVLPAFKED